MNYFNESINKFIIAFLSMFSFTRKHIEWIIRNESENNVVDTLMDCVIKNVWNG